MNATNTIKLRGWRNSRNIKEPNYSVYIKNVLEELLEPIYDKEFVESVRDEIYKEYFSKLESMELDVNAIVDSMCDNSVFTINELELMGYDYDVAMHETIKEINSRKQCPKQAEAWSKSKPFGKWMKDINQDKDTLYSANYELCKR